MFVCATIASGNALPLIHTSLTAGKVKKPKEAPTYSGYRVFVPALRNSVRVRACVRLVFSLLPSFWYCPRIPFGPRSQPFLYISLYMPRQ